MMTSPRTPKTVTRRFVERTFRGEHLGFEAYAWVAQRLTGLIILGFLIIHMYTLSSVTGGETAFDQTMKTMQTPLFKIAELILLWVVLFHGLNGLRLILLNLFPGINHKRLAYSFSLISLVLVIISIPIIL